MILNLVYPEKSDIKYKVSSFPDGQQTLEILPPFPTLLPIVIKSRLNSFRDLELIVCANQALKNFVFSATSINLVVPYFLGARSDRKFQEGGINYLKQVICPIINSQNFNSVTILDPHSDVLEACLNNFKKVNNFNLIDEALIEIGDKNKIILVSPDAGAYKKIFDVGKHFEINKIVTATKIRDLVSGNIIDTHVPLSVYDADKNFVIVDDICDGGRTFIEIAKAIRMSRGLSSAVHPSQYGKIYLIVTHGIFSAGFDQLNEYFDGIFSTNSVSDIGDYVTNSYGTQVKTNLKQLNVF